MTSSTTKTAQEWCIRVHELHGRKAPLSTYHLNMWMFKCNDCWLLRAGYSPAKIHTLVGPLKVGKCHVNYVKKLFEETGNICDRRRASWPCSVRIKNVVNTVHTRITRNPRRKQRILSQELNLAPRIVSHVLREDLGLQVYRRYTGHLLDARLKHLRIIFTTR